MKYRKKPVVIEAMQFNGLEDFVKIIEWMKRSGVENTSVNAALFAPNMRIHTLEGWMMANPGDWIIRGIKNEFYPCKPDIFAATYELVGV